MVVFKMRDSVPGPRYSPVCNVLRQWKTSLIPILIESTESMIYIYIYILENATALGLAYPAARSYNT